MINQIPKQTAVYLQTAALYKAQLYNASAFQESCPQFQLRYGFLPRLPPLRSLPAQFTKMDNILREMPSLLERELLSETIVSQLPIHKVDDIKDTQLLQALFRDYTFLASAFLLENVVGTYRKTQKLGQGKDYLPNQIAEPLVCISEKLKIFPFFEHNNTHLCNFRVKDPQLPLELGNIDLIRTFSKEKDEVEFIAVHIAMVANSAKLVQNTINALDYVEQQQRDFFNLEMINLKNTQEEIISNMKFMWNSVNPKFFDWFRYFLMGIKNSPMFPKGVVFRGMYQNVPQFVRGPSAANDSILPTLDSLLEITFHLPQNPLTNALQEFRQYRPQTHREWLEYVENKAIQVKVKSFALQDPNSSIYYLDNISKVLDFRVKHWEYIKAYVIGKQHGSQQKSAVGTGGTAIHFFLPNQIQGIIEMMTDILKIINHNSLNVENKQTLEKIEKQIQKTRRQFQEAE